METFYFYLFLFFSKTGLELVLEWSIYLILAIFLLITLRLFISGEKLENSIRAALKLSINVFFDILKFLSALYVIFLIIVFIYYASPSSSSCTRCNGDGQVDQKDIERLHKEAEWQPGECGQCKNRFTILKTTNNQPRTSN
jgi:hypothetical protein